VHQLEGTATDFDKLLYTAEAHSTGGRDGGSSRTQDGRLDVKLSPPGTAGRGTNPEQLLAAGWSSCYLTALKHTSVELGIPIPEDVSVDAEIYLGLIGSAYRFAARLTVNLTGMDREAAWSLAEGAHRVCPFSRATSGNISVHTHVVV
jgi:lipoyl-dependent peroxiredoxin